MRGHSRALPHYEGNGDPPRKATCEIRSHCYISSAFLLTLRFVRGTGVPVPPLPSLFPVTVRKIKASTRFSSSSLPIRSPHMTTVTVFVLQSLFSQAQSLCVTPAFHLKPRMLESNAWTRADSCTDPRILSRVDSSIIISKLVKPICRLHFYICMEWLNTAVHG